MRPEQGKFRPGYMPKAGKKTFYILYYLKCGAQKLSSELPSVLMAAHNILTNEK